MPPPSPGTESELDCRACAACCRGAFERISLSPQEGLIDSHPRLVRFRRGAFELARRGDACAALERRTGPAPAWRCRIYAERPGACRSFEAGGDRCLAARRRIGLDS